MRVWLAVLCLATAARAARADEIARGVVVRKEDRAVYVNLGRARGAADGAAIRFAHPITLRHPVTGKRVEDFIPLGAATITAAGDALARVVLDEDLAAAVAVGDVAEIYVAQAPATPPEPAPPAEPLPEVDADTASVLAVWAGQSSRPLAARIAAWEGWLSGHAGSAYADVVRGDLDVLRGQRDELAPPAVGQVTALPSAALDHHAPSRADAGRAVPLVFVPRAGARPPASAWLHFRTIGATTFRRVLLAQDGLALRGMIPADVVRPPGVEYFVEASEPSGRTAAAYATPSAPAEVDVAAAPIADALDETHHSRLSITTTYLDFGNLDPRVGDRTDRVVWTEADVLYRVGRSLWGVRAGYGQYRGTGGFANRTWTAADPAPTAGFTYGYAEAEVRAPGTSGPPVDLALRLIAGVGDHGFGTGIEARGRVGDPDATNLSLLLANIAEIGTFSELRFETLPTREVFVGMSVGVTDQPVQGDLGVRVAADLGWRIRPWLQPTVRASVQGRSADHMGVGGGAGLVFDW